jgi:hypothetical protein
MDVAQSARLSRIIVANIPPLPRQSNVVASLYCNPIHISTLFKIPARTGIEFMPVQAGLRVVNS